MIGLQHELNDKLTLTCMHREELRTTPEKIDAMMESKQVLGAAKLLVASLKQVKSDDMMQIGALNDIRRTLTTQKNVSANESIYAPNINNLWYRHYMICWLRSCIIIYIWKTHSAITDGIRILPDNRIVSWNDFNMLERVSNVRGN